MQLDPNHALAHAYIAAWLGNRRVNAWSVDEEAETAEGVRCAQRAVGLDPDDPTALALAAWGRAVLDTDSATVISWFDRAIALNPNSAMALGLGAVVRNFVGDYETAADHAARAARLSPFDTQAFAFYFAQGVSHLMRRQAPEAVKWLQRSVQPHPTNPPSYFFLASALAHAGRLDEARAAMSRLLELRPGDSLTRHRRRPFYTAEAEAYLNQGAVLAGLPE